MSTSITFFSIPPSTTSGFDTKDELRSAVSNEAKRLGFATSTKSSESKRITIQCVYGDKYCNTHNITEQEKKRKRGSLKQDCPFKVYASFNNDTKKWHIVM